MSNSGGIVNPLPGGTAQASGLNAPYVIVNSDGTITLLANTTTQNWYTPTTTGIGTGYYVKFSKVSGDNADYNQAADWTEITSNFYIGYASGGGAKSGDWTVEIASDSGGTTVVTSGTYTMTYTG